MNVRFTYKNWRGELAERHVTPERIFFGADDYHREVQWLMLAYDLDKKAPRTFAMRDISNWTPAIKVVT